MSIDDDPTTREEIIEETEEKKGELFITLTTPETGKVDPFNRVIKGEFPFPRSKSPETYSISRVLRAEDLYDETYEIRDNLVKKGFHEDKDLFIVDENNDFKPTHIFKGKPVYLRGNNGNISIIKPNLSHIKENKEEEEEKYIQHEKNAVKKIYRDKQGNPITDNEGNPIPIYRSKELSYSRKIDSNVVDLQKFRKYFYLYLKYPENISYDRHSVSKHSFDSIVALNLLLNNPQNPYYEKRVVGAGKKHQKDKPKPLRYTYRLSTKEATTLPGEEQPEKRVHVEIARELANSIKGRFSTGDETEKKRIGKNLRSWIKEFAGDQPLLAIALYNEVKYYLKNNYNLDHNVKKDYTFEEIDTYLADDDIKEILGEKHRYKEEVEKVREIFWHETLRNPNSNFEALLPLESKVDLMIRYFKEKGVDEDSLKYFKLSAGFDRTVKPIVILGTKKKDEYPFPTNSITTSYLKEYITNQFVGNFESYCVCKNGNAEKYVLPSARKARELLNTTLSNVGKNVNTMKNIRISQEEWITALSRQFPVFLKMDREVVERFAGVASAKR